MRLRRRRGVSAAQAGELDGPDLAAADEVRERGERPLDIGVGVGSLDLAFDALPGYFWTRLGPVLDALLDAAKATGEVRADVTS